MPYAERTSAEYTSPVSSDRREVVFLVRMWVEREDSSPEAWRGSVHEIVTGQRLYVTAPAEVADFIALHLSNRKGDGKAERRRQ